MITGKDLYEVLAALVPLYVAMLLAYGSVRWWKIFTPDQCSGINRFVAVFALPLLSFYFISSNDPYAMNFEFIAADCLQKVVILVVLFLWQALFKRGSMEWVITLFSLSTLPNTLVMGIPLLKSMYGDFTADLMVQIVVLQSVVWYTLLLILFEYRGAKLLISEQFPETAGTIAFFHVDSDVVSLNEREMLQTDAQIGEDGKLHVVVRRSPAPSLVSSYNKSLGFNSLTSMTPRASNLSGVEIYSVHSSRVPTPRASSFNQLDIYTLFNASKAPSPKRGYTRFHEGFGDVYPVQSSKGATPRTSSFGAGGGDGGGVGAAAVAPNKELHMFAWRTSNASTISEGNLRHASTDFGAIDPSRTVPRQHETAASKGMHDLVEIMNPDRKMSGDRELEIEEGSKFPASLSSCSSCQKQVDMEGGVAKKHQMPAASVMTKLILIMVWRKLIRNPNTYSSLLGVAWSLIAYRWHIKMPSIVSGSISILSDAGLGMAMFSLGLFMALQPEIIACGKSVATFSMAVRFLVGPAVIAATGFAIGLRGVLWHVAIVQAALPQGIVPFVFAKEYNVHAGVLSTAVIFGMLVALPVAILYYVLLGL